MPQFASYEAVQELHRTGLTSVWSARRSGAGESFAVKVIEPSALILGSQQAVRLEVDRFLAQARLQQKLSAGGAAHWAPVHELDETESGAFYVTDRYKRSGRQFLLSRASMTDALLYNIFSSIVAALQELKASANRPHGNLKPTNVLFGESNDLASAPVYLADPLDDSRLDSAAGWAVDLRAVGELIYQFVVHESPGTGIGWSAPTGPQWKRIGRNGELWRALCNRLLDFDPASRLTSLDELAEAIESLRPRTGKLPLAWVGSAAVLVILFIVGFLMMRPAAVVEEVVNRDAEIAALRVQRENWAFVLPGNAERHGEFRSLLQRGPGAGPLPTLADRLAAGFSSADSGQVGSDLDATLQGVHAVRDHMVTWIDELARRAGEFDQRGWSGPASLLERQAESMREIILAEQRLSLSRGDSFLERMKDAVEAFEACAALNERWSRLTTAAERVAATQVPLLVLFPDFAAASVQSGLGDDWAASADGDQSFNGMLEIVEQFEQFLDDQWEEINQDLVLADPPVETPKPDALAAMHFQQWLQAVQAPCYRNRDPRLSGWDAQQILAPVRRRHEDLLARGGEADSEILAEIRDLEREIERIGELPWTCSTQSTIYAGIDHVQALRPRIESSLDREIAYLSQELEEFLDRLPRNISPTGSPAIDAAWLARVEALRARDPLPGEARREIDAVQSALRSLEEQFPIEMDITGASRESQELIQSAVRQRREAALAEAVGSIEWTEAVLSQGQLAVSAERESAAAELNQWRSEVTTLIAHFATIQSLLDACYALDEEGGQQQSIRALHDRAAEMDVYSQSPTIQAAFTSVVARITAVDAVDRLARAELIERAAAPGRHPEVAFAAWRRLGADSRMTWPETFDDLERERRIQESLRATVATRIADETRRTDLDRELLQEAPRRWLAHASSLTTAAQLERALAVRGEFGIRDDDRSLASAMRWNIRLYEFDRLISALEDVDDQQLQQRIAAFYGDAQQVVNDLPSPSDDAVSRLLAELQALLEEPEEESIDFTQLGPGALGWEVHVADDGSLVRFTPPAGANSPGPMTFRLVETSEGLSYISTTEVPLGTFIDAVDQSGEWAEVSAAVHDQMLTHRPNQGPRTWQWQDRFVPADSWIYQRRVQNDLYPSDLSVDPPGMAHPVQHITPVAAMYAARLLGCRLPTSAEWQAAVTQAAPDRAVAGANVRDATWKQQLDHTLEILERLGGMMPPNRWYEVPHYRVFGQESIAGADANAIWQREGQIVDDGVLWFRPAVAEGDEFHDLIGNVAEYVFDQSEAFETAFAEGEPIAAGTIKAFLGTHHTEAATRMFVVGGSALTHPSIDLTQPQPLAILESWQDFRDRSYSDVGFRLALSVDGPLGGVSLHERLLTLVRHQYILAGPR